MLLLISYPILLIPLIALAMIKDIKAKNEGYLNWHLHSFVILIQRGFFSILMLACFLWFDNCDQDNNQNIAKCINDSLLFLLIPLVFCVFIKVLCFRS